MSGVEQAYDGEAGDAALAEVLDLRHALAAHVNDADRRLAEHAARKQAARAGRNAAAG